MADIVCLGQFTADVVTSPVDSLPENGKTTLVDSISLHNGGCACNAAVALAKLGVSTAVIGKIGCDPCGDFLMGLMDNVGLDTTAMVRDPSVNTSSTVVLIGSDGERSFLHDTGGNAAFSEDDVDYDVIKDAKILHIAATSLVPGLDGEPMARVLARAQELDVTTCLDTAWDATGRWMEMVGPSLSHIDMFVPSIEEAQMLTGKNVPAEIAEVFLGYGIRTVVIKLGPDGCYLRTGNTRLTVPAFEVAEIADTLGAGDSFVAGYLTGIVNGWQAERACRLGNAVGACCVSAPGASGVKPLASTLELYPL